MYYSFISFFLYETPLSKMEISDLIFISSLVNVWLNRVIVVNLKPSESYNLAQISQFRISWFGPDFTIPTNKHDFDQSLQIELNFIIWKKCRSFQQISELWLIVTILTKVKKFDQTSQSGRQNRTDKQCRPQAIQTTWKIQKLSTIETIRVVLYFDLTEFNLGVLAEKKPASIFQ